MIAAIALLIFVIPLVVGASYNTSRGKIRLVVFGAWHALLQIFVAFLLVRKGTWLTLLLAGHIYCRIHVFGKIPDAEVPRGVAAGCCVAWLRSDHVVSSLAGLQFPH